MQTDLVTAMRCDRAFNELQWSFGVYRQEDVAVEADDDPAALRTLRLAALLDDVAHETWVPGYLTTAERDAVEDMLSTCSLRIRHRLGHSGYEIITGGVLERLAERAAQEARVVEEHIPDGGDGRAETYYRDIALGFDTFESLAREAIIDCVLRMDAPGFELRVCAEDGKYFIPRRVGRGRFCRDSCRASYSQRADTFCCAFCGNQRTHREYSGLIVASQRRDENDVWFGPEEREQPHDLRMSAYFPWFDQMKHYTNKSVCIDCVIEHRPAWARYVFASESGARERVS